MRIFVTSDIHANKVIHEKLLHHVPKLDVSRLVICGDVAGYHFGVKDIMDLSNLQHKDVEELESVLWKVDKKCSRLKSSYILGNDDWVDELDHDISGFYPSFFIPESKCLSSVIITPFGTNREVNENRMLYEVRSLNIADDNILFFHDLPYKCGDLDKVKSDGSHVGSKSIRQVLEDRNPPLFFGGHIHEGFGVDYIGRTLVFNCACDPAKDLLRGWVVDTCTLRYWKIIY